MATRELALLTAFGLLAGFAFGTLVDADRLTGDAEEEPPGGGAGDDAPDASDGGEPGSARMRLDPRQPFHAELTQLGGSTGELTVGVNATQVDGDMFGLIARGLGNATGAAGRGHVVEATLTSPAANGSFVFFARSDQEVFVNLTPTRGDLEVSGGTIGQTSRSRTVDLSGTGHQADVETGIPDLVIEVANQGTGRLELVDPEGTTRDTINPGGQGWGLVDPIGEWALVCQGLCAGQAQISVVSYET